MKLMFKKINNLRNDERGVILVLTIMMMAVLFTIAVGFAIFIISDIRQAVQIDNSVLAYYGAEAGLERSLFLFRKSEIENAGALKNILSGDISLTNGVKWNIGGSTDFEPNFLRQRLYSGQSVKLYFLNRSTSGLPERINIDWDKCDGCATKLQVIFTQLNPQIDEEGAVIYHSDKNKVKNIPSDPACEKFLDEEVADNSGSNPPYDYVVEIRSLGTTNNDFIENLNVLAYDGDSCSGSFNPEAITNITLRSTGSYNRARQEIIAQIPPRDPVSGLLGYVLFSEEDITKGY